MKKITFLITLLTISISFGQELITDGGFENSNASALWTKTGANMNLTFPATSAYDGSVRANMGNESGSMRQNITPSLNVEYTVTFWWKFNDTNNTKNAAFSIRTNINNTQLTGLTLPAATFNYTKAITTFTSTSTTDVRFQIYKDKQATSTNNSMSIDLVSIVPTSSLAVDDLEQFNFGVYPNPATNYMNLSASKNIDKIEIYNVVGQKVESRILNSNNNQMNVSNLSKGVYIMKAFIDDAVGTYKFVKE